MYVCICYYKDALMFLQVFMPACKIFLKKFFENERKPCLQLEHQEALEIDLQSSLGVVIGSVNVAKQTSCGLLWMRTDLTMQV